MVGREGEREPFLEVHMPAGGIAIPGIVERAGRLVVGGKVTTNLHPGREADVVIRLDYGRHVEIEGPPLINELMEVVRLWRLWG